MQPINRLTIFVQNLLAMKKLFFAIVCLVAILQSFAQNTVVVNAQVIPPYSPYISTYVDNPNKLILTLTNTSAQQQNVKLWVRISGDNGVSGTTTNGFKPFSPIVLPPYQTKVIDFSSAETKSYFDANNVTLVGITKAQLIQNQALPEGAYTICVKALDYNTSQPLSVDGQGCSAPFLVSYIDPCMLTQPLCNGDVTQTEPQNILFTWTPPATAPGNLQYEFTLKEVPNNLNPNDVIKNAAFPVVYSYTGTAINSLLYTNALPQLTAAKKYVWRIKCIDPTNTVQFKNNGYSQPCTFNYKAKAAAPNFNIDPTVNAPSSTQNKGGSGYNPVSTPNQGNIYLPPIVQLANVNGQLVYNWQSGANKNYPMTFATIRLVVKHFLLSGLDTLPAYTSICYDGICDGAEIAVTKTDANGNFNFSFASAFPFGKIADKHTSGSGEFKSIGTLYRQAVIEILYPHNQYYHDPTQKILPIPGESVNVGIVTSAVKTCKLEVTVVRKGGVGNQLYGTSNNTLPDAKVYLCRKPISIFAQNSFPKDDGLPKKVIVISPGSSSKNDKLEALSAVEVVAQTKSKSNGKVVFERVALHNNSNYQYFIYADFDKTATGFYNYTSVNGPEKFKKEVPPGGFNISNGVGETYVQTLTMNPEPPRIAGVVIDKFDGKPKSGLITLNSIYVSSGGKTVLTSIGSTQAEYDAAEYFYSCASFCARKVTRSFYRGNSGEFEFNKLAVLYDLNEKKITGPLHLLTAKAPGYDDKNHGISEILYYGSQHYAELKLDRGGEIAGRIVDGETGKGLAANFYFIDENKSDKCNSSGYFSGYPARKLTTKQKLIISYPGYITDTAEVLVDKEKTDLGTLKIYTLNRRLTVSVRDEKTGKSIENASVEILGVTTTCKAKSGQFNIVSQCPLMEKTKKLYSFLGIDIATASFSFKNAGGQENNGQIYKVRITGPDSSNYESTTISTAIPYSSKSKTLQVKLKPATCIAGYVYAGKGNTSPVQGARVKMDVTAPAGYSFYYGQQYAKTSEVEATSDANGYYELKNVPLRDYPQIVRAMKGSADLVGDSFVIVTQPSNNSSYYNFSGGSYKPGGNYGNMNFNANSLIPGSQKSSCIKHDFNLTVYNGLDLSSLMGFPIEVSSLKPNGTNGAIITGQFVSLNGNDQFNSKPNSSLQFKNIKVLPSATIKNDKGIPAAAPESTPITTENNMLPLLLYNSVDGMVEDKKLGIYLDKDVGGKQYGVIKGKVKMLNTAFNQSVIAFGDTFYLALPNETSISKLIIPVINADKTIKNPAIAPSGFKIANSVGYPVKFSLPGFANSVLSDYDATTFFNGELNLTARIQTDIKDITPSNLNIALSNIKLRKGTNPSINSSTPISFNMGNWKLSSSDFVLDENGLKLNKGTIDAGVSVPFKNLGIRYNQLFSNATEVQLDEMKLAEMHPVNIVSTNKTFGLIDVAGGKKAWQIYAGPTPDVAATISNLPALNSTDKIELSSIRLLSNGEQRLALRAKPVTLRNLLKFTPLDATYISASANQFLITGLFQLKLPDPKSFSTTLMYERSGNSLNFSMVNTEIVSFNKPTQLAHKFDAKPTLTNGKFTYNGTSEEAGTFPATKTTLYYTNDSVSVWIDGGQDIPISGARKFGKAEGGMRIEANNWTPFWFSGDMEGMAGISDVQVGGKKQRMKFFVQGEVTADAQSLSVKNVETPFGDMTWTYKFPESRLIGYLGIDMNLNAMHLSGNLNTIVDGSGWFFGIDGNLKVTGVGDLGFMGIFGDYPQYPPGIKLNMGDFKCLPPAFNNKVNGFLFQAGIHKQVVPEINMGIPGLLTIGFGVDVGLNTRLWKSFGENNNQLGLSLLARGHAFAKGDCEVTCSSVEANANAEVSISGTYNGTNGEYNINGCSSVGFSLEAQQCLGALGLCSSTCAGISTGDINVGINLNYNSNKGADIGIQFSSCSSSCK